VVLNQPIGALAHIGLGRAYALQAAAAQGDQAASFRAKARTAYQEFLTRTVRSLISDFTVTYYSLCIYPPN